MYIKQGCHSIQTYRFLEPINEVCQIWIIPLVADYSFHLEHLGDFCLHGSREYERQNGQYDLQDEQNAKSIGELYKDKNYVLHQTDKIFKTNKYIINPQTSTPNRFNFSRSLKST